MQNIQWIKFVLAGVLIFSSCSRVPISPSDIMPTETELLSGAPYVYRIPPDPRGGIAAKTVYVVDVPIDVVWGFLTDFNRSIKLEEDIFNYSKTTHREIFRSNDRVRVVFKSVHSTSGQLGFTDFTYECLLEAKEFRIECEMIEDPRDAADFGYTKTILSPFGKKTKVTHFQYAKSSGVKMSGISIFSIKLAIESARASAEWEKKKIESIAGENEQESFEADNKM